MVETEATPSPETDGKPRKTPRQKEIGRGGGAAPVCPPGIQAQEDRTTGASASAPWWKGPEAGLAGAFERGPGVRLREEWVEGAAGLVGVGRRSTGRRGASGLGLETEDQARGDEDRRTCRGPQGDSGGSQRPSVGLKTPRMVKMTGTVGSGLPPSKRESDQSGDRSTGGSPCSVGLRLLMAQFLSLRTGNRGRKRGTEDEEGRGEGKEATGERREKGRCALELAGTPRPGPVLTHLRTQGQAPGVPAGRGLSRGAALPEARGRGGQHGPDQDGSGG
ncbi:hypothetical protein NN561_007522 [Cricetulus griseus]